MFEAIVLALDGSAGSQPAIPVATELATRYGSKLVIVHVDERVAAKGGIVPIRDEDEIRAELKALAEELSSKGVDTTLEIVEMILGGPAQKIEEVADGASADLIVAGRRGHSPVVGLLLGSVTQRLLNIARRSVLAAPPAD